MRNLILFLTLVLMTSACSPFHLESSQVLNKADMNSYKTFKIQAAEGATLPEGMTMRDAENIANAISKELLDRGYTAVQSNPDMIVYLALSVKTIISTKDAIPNRYGYNYFPVRGSYIHNYYSDAKIISDISDQGMLMMDIVDSARNIHIFCSEVSSLAEGQNIRDLEKIAEAASVLFSKFPLLPLKK
jgi:hypothetical protein